jgi:hypothetical protein
VYGHVLITLEHSSSRCYLLVYLSLSYHYSCLLLGRTTMPGPWINPYLSAGCRFVFYLGPTIWQPLAVITCSSVKCQTVRLLSEPQKFGHFFFAPIINCYYHYYYYNDYCHYYYIYRLIDCMILIPIRYCIITYYYQTQSFFGGSHALDPSHFCLKLLARWGFLRLEKMLGNLGKSSSHI